MGQEKKPKISIISVSYNTGNYLRNSLDSLLHQTLREIEVIGIDNGSTDHSAEILQEYARNDGRVQYHNIADSIGVRGLRGLPNSTDYSSCLNYGFSLAQGEYVYILDCDDWLELNALERLYETAKERNVDVLAFNTTMEYETKELSEKYKTYEDYVARPFPCDEVLSGKDFLSLMQEHGEYQWNMFLYLIKNSFLQEERIKAHMFGADILFTFQLFLSAGKASLCNETFHHYLMRAHSGTESLENTKAYSVKKLAMTYTELVTTFYYHNCSKEQDPQVYNVLRNIMKALANTQYSQPAKQSLALVESLYTYEHFLLDTPLSSFQQAGVTEADFFQQREEMGALCLFGAGFYGNKVLETLRAKGGTDPVAFCDNNKDLWGTEVEGVAVLSIEQVLADYPQVHVLVTSAFYYPEILNTLSQNIPAERLWFYPMTEDKEE